MKYGHPVNTVNFFYPFVTVLMGFHSIIIIINNITSESAQARI